MHRTQLSTCVVVGALIVIGSTPAFGQNTGINPAPQNTDARSITIHAVGGFLGQVEGFCEDKGGAFDWPTDIDTKKGCSTSHPDARWLGGVIGASAVVPKRPRRPFEFVVVPAHNQPLTTENTFFGNLAAIDADMVALGSEDFDRLIRGRDATAERVVHLVAGDTGIPFVASNVVIRDTAPHLNIVDDNGFELHITEDSTVDWTKTITLDYPKRAVPTIHLKSADACPLGSAWGIATQVEDARIEEKTETADAQLVVAKGLKPGRCYELDISNSDGKGQLRFTTDAALTPIHHATAEYDSLPVVINADGTVVMVNAVDPGVRSRAAEPAWKWKSAGRTHEMLFPAPADVVTAVLQTLAAKTGAKPASIILAASLPDAGLLTLLEKFPQIRFVVLDPDSHMLGRAANASAAKATRHYSGDLGFAAIVDPQYDIATKIFVRPEWFGETLINATADMSLTNTGDWSMTKATAGIDVVNGAPFTSKSGKEVDYSVEWPAGMSVPIGRAPRYEDCPETSMPSPRCHDFVELWSAKENVAEMVGDAVRRKEHADLAVVPADIVDEDFIAWVTREVEDRKNDAGWISHYILTRMIYAGPRMVRSFVAGVDLPATLVKIQKANAENCVVGLGDLCAAADENHPAKLTINGRRTDRRLFYSIVLPDALADTLGLEHDDAKSLLDPVTVANDYLESGAWYVAQNAAGQAIPKRTELRGERRYGAYWALSSLDFGFAKTTLHDPAGVDAASIRGNLPVDFKGALPSKTTTVVLDSDLAPVDQSTFAVRLPVTLNYSRRKQGATISYDTDQFAGGVRVDYKLKIAGELRPFVGGFVDGPLKTRQTNVAATADFDEGVIHHSDSIKLTQPFVERPSRYEHVAAGIDWMGYREFGNGSWTFAPTVVGGRWAIGTETRVPQTITLGEVTLDSTKFLSLGVSGTLNDFFLNNRAALSPDAALVVHTERRRTYRPQGDAAGKVTYKHGNKSFVTDFAVQVRGYRYAQTASDYALKYTEKFDYRFSIPFFRRLNITWHHQYQRAGIYAKTNNVFSYMTWDITLSLPMVIRWGHTRLWR